MPERLSFGEKETAKLPYLIAANIWNTINEESEEYQQSFMKGLQDCQEGLPNDKEHLDDKTYIFSKIYEKSKETELFFKNLEKEKDIVCLEPQKLYFQVLEKGSGPSYKGQRKIKCRSSFKSTTGEILSDTFNTGPATIDLSEVIYGFAKGLSGMQVGEIRQIYIHPNLGYGLLSSADKGGYLTCKIQLLSIDSEDTFELTSSILPKNLEIPTQSEELVRMWNQTHGYSHGYRIWQHYGKGDAELVKKVLIELEKLKGDVDISDVQSQNLLNRLHWNLYHK